MQPALVLAVPSKVAFKGASSQMHSGGDTTQHAPPDEHLRASLQLLLFFYTFLSFNLAIHLQKISAVGSPQKACES